MRGASRADGEVTEGARAPSQHLDTRGTILCDARVPGRALRTDGGAE